MLSSLTAKVIYSGDGSNTSFLIPFSYIDTTAGTDITVSVVDNVGNVTTLAGNYTIDQVNKNINYPTIGGQSPLQSGVLALPAGWQLVIQRIEPLTQNLALINQGIFDAASINSAFDKLTMICQQLQEQINRCVKYPIQATPTPTQLNPSTLTFTVAPLIAFATLAQLKVTAAAAPATAFWGFATDLGAVGQLCFYSGNTAMGDPDSKGFIFLGGG